MGAVQSRGVWPLEAILMYFARARSAVGNDGGIFQEVTAQLSSRVQIGRENRKAKTRESALRRHFAYRGQLFVGDSTQNETMLTEIFNMRGATEHLKPFEIGCCHLQWVLRRKGVSG
jgi:hypothetical protein